MAVFLPVHNSEVYYAALEMAVDETAHKKLAGSNSLLLPLTSSPSLLAVWFPMKTTTEVILLETVNSLTGFCKIDYYV